MTEKNNTLWIDATHLLRCVHAMGKNRLTYFMRCIPLKTMDDGRIKVIVFGDRYWKDKNKQRVRYVEADRVSELN